MLLREYTLEAMRKQIPVPVCEAQINMSERLQIKFSTVVPSTSASYSYQCKRYIIIY